MHPLPALLQITFMFYFHVVVSVINVVVIVALYKYQFLFLIHLGNKVMPVPELLNAVCYLTDLWCKHYQCLNVTNCIVYCILLHGYTQF